MRPPSKKTEPLGDAYWEACQARIESFVRAHYRWPGVWRAHRAAIGLDLLKAPANIMLAIPALAIQISAYLFQRLGAGQLAHWMCGVPLGFRTAVETTLADRLQREVLGLNVCTGTTTALIARYAETRRAASDVAAALAVGLVGLVVVEQFTPGSVSAGQELAAAVVHHTAVQNFVLGDWLGGWYYHFFPPDVPLWSTVIGVLVVAAAMAVFSAFSGLITDPLQARLGVHQARLRRWLGTFRAVAEGTGNGTYTPRDPYIARLVDFADALKGIIG